ncbi:MAG: hypothetical protein R3Y68_07745 [Rikenellaceae bacterium]
MKRLVLILALAIATTSYSYAAKERSTAEVAQKELKAKVDKESRKSSKQMTKEGWQTMPGRVTMDKQIERSKLAELSVDDKGCNIYLIGTHKATGGNYSAAKNIATVRAKGELASQLSAHIKRNIMDKNSNKQISADQIQLLDETVSATLESVDIDISGVNNLLEVYREGDDGKCEVMVTLSVKSEQLVDQAVERISQELSSKTDLLFK